MPRSSGVFGLTRRCFRTLIVLLSLAVTAGLACAVPAQASPAASSSAASSPAALSSVMRQAATGIKETATTASDGDLTVDVDAGTSYNKATMQQLINQIQGQNPRLSDTFKRMFEQGVLQPPAGTPEQDYDPARDPNWQNFDGTLSMDSDGTGISVTVPAAEVQTSASWLTEMLAAGLGAAVNLLLRVVCVGGLLAIPGAAAFAVVIQTGCAVLSSFAGTIVRFAVIAGITGDPFSGPAWAQAVAVALVLAVPAGLWELGLGAFVRETMVEDIKSFAQWVADKLTNFWTVPGVSIASAASTVAGFLNNFADALPAAVDAASTPSRPTGPSCDIYSFYGTPCTAAYSTTRALYSAYDGPLYQVQRVSDNTTQDIGLLSAGGYVDAAQQVSFCAGTTCTISRIYDQSPEWNDLTVFTGQGSAAGADHGAIASALPITVAGHVAYGVDFSGQTGYRDDHTQGIATGDAPEGMYMVASGTNVNNQCCFDFGNAETSNDDDGAGRMDAVNLSTTCYFEPCTGSGPWVQADLENGLFQGDNGSNLANAGNSSNFVTAMLKNDGQTTYALKGGNAQSGGLSTWWDGSLPTLPGYMPMRKEGAIILGTGGDNSNRDTGSFFEGVMTQGYPSDAADNAVQANITSASYAGNSDPTGNTSEPPDAAAGAAVVHSGYTSVYSVDSSNGDLEETYLPAMGDSWSHQNLSAKYHTPQVMPGTQPVALVHSGYTSVYTVDAGSGDLQETYLPAMGDGWSTQDLTAKYHTPPTNVTPTAVVHSGYTSVYTVDESNGHLDETYLPALGDGWSYQDLSAKYHTPAVLAGTSPVSIVHSGYTSVYTVDANHDLQETYLPAMGDGWSTQDLSAKYHTPETTRTPTAVVHQGYTSVYTVDDSNNHLQETFLPAMGDGWSTQDLSAKYGTPWVAPGTQPVALYHTGYTSVYTVDGGTDHLEETYLSNVGNGWASQDMTVKYHTPSTVETPVPLVHPDTSGNLTWTSVYTTDEFTGDLQETYLPAIGDGWTTQDLSAKYSADQVAETDFPTAGMSVVHDGYTSVYTRDAATGDLQESYLTAMGKPWATQNLSVRYKVPPVEEHTRPVAIVHDGYVSVYTVDAATGDLQESYLPALGDGWSTQDLSTICGHTPQVASGTSPAAVFHDGYISVYTVDSGSHDLQETYLSNLGNCWATQDQSTKYGTPPVGSLTDQTSPVAVYHDGYVSVYTVDASGNLDETYLAAIGDLWAWQSLSAKYGAPQVAADTSPSAVFHDGYTSVYTVDAGSDDLQETYLPAMGDAWGTQNLTANYGAPAVAPLLYPLLALYHTGYTSVYTVDKSTGDLYETYLPAIGDGWSFQDLTQKYNVPAPSRIMAVLVHPAVNGALTWTSVFTADDPGSSSGGDLQESFLPAMGDGWSTQDLTQNPPNVPPL